LTRLFFATDIHGSDVCWKKFLNAGAFYQADVLVLGGDMTGKALVPIVRLPDGSYRATLLEQQFILDSRQAVAEIERSIRSRGYYPFHTDEAGLAGLLADAHKVDALFKQQMLETLERWMALAEERLTGTRVRCFVCPGNDDLLEVDEIVQRSSCVTLSEGRAVAIDGDFSMISTGWSNRTPWHTYREASEEELAARIERMVAEAPDMAHTIFNFHCPPYASRLDDAAELDAELRPVNAGHATVPVGSTAVRAAIERYQPPLSLHGHIHESKGAVRIGRTLAINPGSMYEQGLLLGALIDLDRRKGVKNYLLTSG
jgi:Icc-related predicted phosphoesterase